MTKVSCVDLVLAGTLLTTITRILWRTAESNRYDPVELFTGAGLDPAAIDVPRARFPFDSVCNAWLTLAARTENPCLGLEAAAHYRIPDLHALGITFLASTNLLQALRLVDRYERALNTGIDYEVSETGMQVSLVCATQEIPEPATRIIEDLRNAVFLSLAREGLGEPIVPLEVGFTYPAPAHQQPYLDHFNCPIRFSVDHSYISFKRSDALLPFTARNVDLARANDRILAQLLDALNDRDYLCRVKEIVARTLPSGTPTEAEVASAVFTSPRTLHRRLAEHGTSFRGVLSSVRRELSEGYLRDDTIPITEICYLVGFSDVSAFSRAFKRWTGRTPGQFRNRQWPE